MIAYDLNWMGPLNAEWLQKHGYGWSGGRIDSSSTLENPYGKEYGLSIMDTRDWHRLSSFVDDLTSEKYFKNVGEILNLYYQAGNPRIVWWVDA